MPRLHELQAVARARLNTEDDGIGHHGDIGFRLAYAYGLDQHPVIDGAHQHHGRHRQPGEAPQPVACRHGAHEDACVIRVGAQAGAVAQQGTTGAL